MGSTAVVPSSEAVRWQDSARFSVRVGLLARARATPVAAGGREGVTREARRLRLGAQIGLESSV